MNRANKSQDGFTPRAGWSAQQAKQGTKRQRKTIGGAGITAGQGNGLADDMVKAVPRHIED